VDCNPGWDPQVSSYSPDGDAELSRLDDDDYPDFNVPNCPYCGGIVKPDVVFFGEPVPSERVSVATVKLEQSEALLVIGSSLMVFSGYRFARLAHQAEIPVVIINRGRTRADDIATHKLASDCSEILPQIAGQLAA
jgi:NAD-dependent SIR2 family protein deacetylase